MKEDKVDLYGLSLPPYFSLVIFLELSPSSYPSSSSSPPHPFVNPSSHFINGIFSINRQRKSHTRWAHQHRWYCYWRGVPVWHGCCAHVLYLVSILVPVYSCTKHNTHFHRWCYHTLCSPYITLVVMFKSLNTNPILTLTLPSPYVGMGGSLTVTVA